MSKNKVKIFSYRQHLSTLLVTIFCFVAVSASMVQAETYLHSKFTSKKIALLKKKIKLDAAWVRSHKSYCARPSNSKNKLGKCDRDKDGLSSYIENKTFGTKFNNNDTDSDGLSDKVELFKYGTNPKKADSDGDGIPDLEEISTTHTNPNNPDSDGDGVLDGGDNGACQPPNFDSAGNTTAFGIPSSLVGNVSAGASQYQQTCNVCHSAGNKGLNLSFSQLRTATSGFPMFMTSLSDQAIANLVAHLNRSNLGGTGNCDQTPTPAPSPQPGTPTATPNPVATPTPLPTPCSGGLFDSTGNTVAGAFSIPNGFTGNISAGYNVFTQRCSGCHGSPIGGMLTKGYHLSYPQIVAAVTGPLMGITNITAQQYSDMTAAANFDNGGGNCTGSGTPTPTPTPLNQHDRGRFFYLANCSSCHHVTPDGDVRNASVNKINEAIAEKWQMNYLSTLPQSTIIDISYYLRHLP